LTDDLLTGAEAIGEFLSMSERQVRRLHDLGQLPSWKDGRVLRARRSSLIAWVEYQHAKRRNTAT